MYWFKKQWIEIASSLTAHWRSTNLTAHWRSTNLTAHWRSTNLTAHWRSTNLTAHWRSVTLTIVVLLHVSITPAFSQSAPSGRVKATTRDESDKPVAGVLVEIKKDNAVVSSGTSDEKGEANLAGVPA